MIHWLGFVLFIGAASSVVGARSEAVQLLAPTEAHDGLVVTAEGRAWLSGLDRPFRVVSVMGALHTGKSFLANTLVTRGRDRGEFVMGHTTDAMTMGVWWVQGVARRLCVVCHCCVPRRRASLCDNLAVDDGVDTVLLDTEVGGF